MIKKALIAIVLSTLPITAMAKDICYNPIVPPTQEPSPIKCQDPDSFICKNAKERYKNQYERFDDNWAEYQEKINRYINCIRTNARDNYVKNLK